MAAPQIRTTAEGLRSRGWRADLRTRLCTHTPTYPVKRIPARIQMAFLEERAVFLPAEQASEAAAMMRAGG